MRDEENKYLTELLDYARYLTIQRWAIIVILFLASFAVFALNIINSPEIFPFYGYLITNYTSIALVIFNICVITLVVGSVYPSIQCLRAEFGLHATIRPYAGKWIFQKKKKWYFSAWIITDINGAQHAAITLGADIKESLRL